MSKSIYVVNNMEQEDNVLKALIESGYKHPHTEKYKYSFVPSINGSAFDGFPYEIIADKEEHNIYWRTIPKQMVNVSQLNRPDELIIYDGREENDKMKISKEVYDALVDWKHDSCLEKCYYVTPMDFKEISFVVKSWWLANGASFSENNNRIIAIIKWINGEDVFEVEKPKKWIVQSKKHDGVNRNFYVNVSPDKTWFGTTVEKGLATQFDTKEEADKYVNSLTESVPYK